MNDTKKEKLIIDFYNENKLPIDTRYLNEPMIFNKIHVKWLWENDKEMWKKLADYIDKHKGE